MTSEKPKYEKPIALPLGEAAKGSGACNAGSGVGPLAGSGSSGICASGGSPGKCCQSGMSPHEGCSQGFAACQCWAGSGAPDWCGDGLSFV